MPYRTRPLALEQKLERPLDDRLKCDRRQAAIGLEHPRNHYAMRGFRAAIAYGYSKFASSERLDHDRCHGHELQRRGKN